MLGRGGGGAGGLELGRYIRRGTVTKFGNLKGGRTTALPDRGHPSEEGRGGGSGEVRTRSAILRVLRRRFWIRDGAVQRRRRRHFHEAVSVRVLRGLRGA